MVPGLNCPVQRRDKIADSLGNHEGRPCYDSLSEIERKVHRGLSLSQRSLPTCWHPHLVAVHGAGGAAPFEWALHHHKPSRNTGKYPAGLALQTSRPTSSR